MKEKLQAELSTSLDSYNEALQTYVSYDGLDELTDKLAAELVERVTISPDGEITVRLKYADVLAGLYKSCCRE